MRVLVAGVGNVLHRDDGFGVAVAEHLDTATLPEGTTVVETGIGGVALVQELLTERFDALVIVDAVDRCRPPGTVLVIDPEVPDVSTLTPDQRQDLLADAHLATPDRVLMLARALGVLPSVVRVVGCQPEDADGVGTGMSPRVARAVPRAADEVRGIIAQLRADGVRHPRAVAAAGRQIRAPSGQPTETRPDGRPGYTLEKR
jgi:hydrogenase maturation protease